MEDKKRGGVVATCANGPPAVEGARATCIGVTQSFDDGIGRLRYSVCTYMYVPMYIDT